VLGLIGSLTVFHFIQVRPSSSKNLILERMTVPHSTETKTAINFKSTAPYDITKTSITTAQRQQKQRPQQERHHQQQEHHRPQHSKSSHAGTYQWWESLVDDVAQPWTAWTASGTRTSFLSSHSHTNNGDNNSDNNSSKTIDPFQWCVVPGSQEYHPRAGIYFVKVPKSGSTTCASVSMQIAQNVATRRQQQNQQHYYNNTTTATTTTTSSSRCRLRFHHGFDYAHRQAPFFLWTVIRDPVSRLKSHYFFGKVSRGRKAPSPRAMMIFADLHVNYQLSYLSHLESHGNQPRYKLQGRERYMNTNQTTRNETATREEIVFWLQNDVMDAYHFIALAERMEESMVVLQLLFQLEPIDMIVLSSKQVGGYDDGAYNKTCFRIQPPVHFPNVDAYLNKEFKVDNYDFFLHAVVNRSLDLTIDALGRDLVERHVQQHKALHAYASEQCQSQAIFPCSNNGTLQREASSKSCLYGDMGCGYQCVRKALTEYQQHQQQTQNQELDKD
jgi:hypothetical protein